YIALSHCWGKGEGILTTTTSTIEERRREITWSSLPKTFQDAISITRALEIEYLWIDSLCIIQDDHLDWQAESVKMADVYSQSYLTIAATASSTSLGGCLFNRWHETLDGHEIPHSISKFHSERTDVPPEIKLRYSARGHEYFAGNCPDMGNDALLLTRAWAFQERILSKRIIHFHSEEMIWECQECRSCECGYFDWEKSHLVYDHSFHELVKKTFAKLHAGHGTQEDIYRTWRKLIEMFTALDITEELDRLPAVSGLASCISQRLDSLYMAGLWKDDLPRGLLWNKRPYQRSQRIRFAEDHYAPTWSWASI
ncbi:HET-domain-containing protein, partial [Hyaloscypha hepaticicola]